MKKLMKLSMLSTGLMTLGIMASSGVNAQGACSVDYKTVNTWGNGGQYAVTLTNTGAISPGGANAVGTLTLTGSLSSGSSGRLL